MRREGVRLFSICHRIDLRTISIGSKYIFLREMMPGPSLRHLAGFVRSGAPDGIAAICLNAILNLSAHTSQGRIKLVAKIVRKVVEH